MLAQSEVASIPLFRLETQYVHQPVVPCVRDSWIQPHSDSLRWRNQPLRHRPGKKPLCCSACGSSAVHPRGRTERTFRTLPIGSKAVVVHFEVPRVHCASCGLIRQVEIGFADERRSVELCLTRFRPFRSSRLLFSSLVGSCFNRLGHGRPRATTTPRS